MYGRQFWKDYALWFALFFGALQLAYWLAHDLPEAHPLRWIALLPLGVATVGGLWIELRNLRRLDELQRLIYLEATTISVGFVASWSVAAMLMEIFLKLPRPAPHWTLLVLGIGFLVGLLISRRQHL
jgi:hypothetical protein